MTVVVVGAGVVGLTCAVRLAEAKHRVRVLTREAPLDTTSAVAAAVWFPYLCGSPERVNVWAARTYRVLVELAQRVPESGVVLRELLVLGRGESAVPPWSGDVEGFRSARRDELPPGYRSGFCARVPVAETPRYLPWLERRLLRAGATIEVVPAGVESLESAGEGAALVVHCSGLGARTLAGDATMTPVRGQVALVENPGIDRIVVDEDDPAGPTYVIPRRDDCVVGGTAERGDESLRPDPVTTGVILRRATRLVPALAGMRLLGVRVGLRPGRPEVRLELEEPASGPPVVHCYGHGGAGFTLAWGCADVVLAHAQATLGI